MVLRPLSLPPRARLQLKTAVMLPYLGQRNVSIFSQWIRGWFVWILLINCSHVNYWCSSVRPAFPVTDGLFFRVIHPPPPPNTASFPMLQLQSGERISISCFPSPPLPPCCVFVGVKLSRTFVSWSTWYRDQISLTSCSLLNFCHLGDIPVANFLSQKSQNWGGKYIFFSSVNIRIE